MEKKNEFGKGFIVGGLVGLGVGVAGTCIAAALMTDDDIPDEIDDQETKDSEEKESTTIPFFKKEWDKKEDPDSGVNPEEKEETAE